MVGAGCVTPPTETTPTPTFTGHSLNTPNGVELKPRGGVNDTKAPDEEVEEILGKPARVDKTEGGVTTYFYPSKGLQVTLTASGDGFVGRDFIICPPWKE